MDKCSPNILASLLRAGRLVLHLLYGMLLAIFYPHLSPTRQRRILKRWSRQLLGILNIGIQIEGHQPVRNTGGCLMVANHVSWLDIFVLNAIHPARFIAKSEVRGWPIIGWLGRRSGTIFVERAMRQDVTSVNQRVGALLKQGDCISLFPEGTTTDGKQVGYFHSSLIQPAIDAEIKLHPVALRYQDDNGKISDTAAFTGDTTLVRSIWRILRCNRHQALVAFTPTLITADQNRRELARTAQQAIAQALLNIAPKRQYAESPDSFTLPQAVLSPQSSYALLIEPMLNDRAK